MIQEETVASSRVRLSQQVKVLAAAKRLSASWFQPSKTAISAAEQRLRRDGVVSDSFIDELKSDAALFTFCLRELFLLSKAGEIRPAASPSDLFFRASNSHWNRILGAAATVAAQHQATPTDQLQAERIKQMMLSAVTAELLGERLHHDRTLCYAGALLRQLGYTLIAWNYPHLFRKALAQGERIDQALTSELGYSPKLLAIALAREWGAPASMRAALGDVCEEESVIVKAGNTIAKLCEVAEAFAQLDSEQSARGPWQDALHHLQHVLGPQALQLVEQSYRHHCRYYTKWFGPEFALLLDMPAGPQGEHEWRVLCHANRALKRCPSELQQRFEALYRMLTPKEIVKDSLRSLLREIVPAAGFSNGCIYLYDFEARLLVPRYRVGTRRNYAKIDCSPLCRDPDRLAETYRSDAPTLRFGLSGAADTSSIASRLGRVQRAGVVYLEVSRSLLNAGEQQALARFEAIVQALQDCLWLS